MTYIAVDIYHSHKIKLSNNKFKMTPGAAFSEYNPKALA